MMVPAILHPQKIPHSLDNVPHSKFSTDSILYQNFHSCLSRYVFLSQSTKPNYAKAQITVKCLIHQLNLENYIH